MAVATRSKRQPTEAQRAAAADRRDRMRKLAATISAMSEEQRAALVGGGVATIEGRPLSLFNTCMVLSQSGGASVVGGFQQWRKAGRCVRKGEHGLAIWIPIGDDREGAKPAEGEKSGVHFMLGTVFDISQTDPIEGA